MISKYRKRLHEHRKQHKEARLKAFAARKVQTVDIEATVVPVPEELLTLPEIENAKTGLGHTGADDEGSPTE